MCPDRTSNGTGTGTAPIDARRDTCTTVQRFNNAMRGVAAPLCNHVATQHDRVATQRSHVAAPRSHVATQRSRVATQRSQPCCNAAQLCCNAWQPCCNAARPCCKAHICSTSATSAIARSVALKQRRISSGSAGRKSAPTVMHTAGAESPHSASQRRALVATRNIVTVAPKSVRCNAVPFDKRQARATGRLGFMVKRRVTGLRFI
jgi:hypothetical protein